MGKACECGCICIGIYIKIALMISSLIVCCDLLLPIINYSKMKDAKNIENIEIDNINYNTADQKVRDKISCYKFISEYQNIIPSFKMKQIKAFSIGLITLNGLQLALEVFFFVILVGSCCCFSNDTVLYYTLLYLISALITYLIHLLFFVLFAVFYFIGKKAAKDYNKCDITSYFKNCRDFLIADCIFIFISFWLICSGWVSKDK